MASELLSQFCTFEHSTECSKVSFHSDSIAKGSIVPFFTFVTFLFELSGCILLGI